MTKTPMEIIEGAGRDSARWTAVARTGGAVGTGLRLAGNAALLFNAARDSYELATSVSEFAQGDSVVGAGRIVTSALGLTLDFAMATTTVLTGVGFGVALVAGGSVYLLGETVEAASTGGPTPIDVADRFYGTHLGDIAGWISGDYSTH